MSESMDLKIKGVNVGSKTIGPGHPCFCIAEIGINHNGEMKITKRLIDVAVDAGCDAVKFQKRTVDIVYSKSDLERIRDNPFGPTNGDLKRGLEFGADEFHEISKYCKEKDILWFSSCWDEGSVDFMEDFDPPAYKIASASLTDQNLLKHTRATGKPVILSTGMSSLDEIRRAIKVLGKENLIVMHCTSTYPARPEELNLNALIEFQKEFMIPIGYSGHEVGLQTTIAAVVKGACAIERHITLDRSLWGTDQSASIEPQGLVRLIRDIRTIEIAMGDGIKRVYESEIPIRKKLRRVDFGPESFL